MFVKQLTILLSLSSALFAGTSTETAAPATKETSFADDLWSHAVLYQNAEGPFFQKIRVLGRYHTNYAWVEDDTSDWDYRRGRLGLNFEFLTQFELRNEWNVDGLDDDDFDPSFSTIDTLFLTWKANPAFQLTAGKHKAPLTQEFRMSSNEMITVERTVLTQSIVSIDRTWGVSAKGAIDRWSYLAGVYAASFDGDYNESFESDGSNYGLASIACDFGNESQIWGKAMVTAQYAYLNDPTRVGPRFDHTTSLSFEGTSRKFGLAMDFMYGWGDNEVGGFHIIPSYFVTDKIELVARYSWASGDDDTLALRRRYETLTTRGSGDEYHSIYAGANYYLYGHKLKLLLGAEYLNMSDSAKNGGDFDGVTAMAGLAFWF